jgi:hypothetical protein
VLDLSARRVVVRNSRRGDQVFVEWSPVSWFRKFTYSRQNFELPPSGSIVFFKIMSATYRFSKYSVLDFLSSVDVAFCQV